MSVGNLRTVKQKDVLRFHIRVSNKATRLNGSTVRNRLASDDHRDRKPKVFVGEDSVDEMDGRVHGLLGWPTI